MKKFSAWLCAFLIRLVGFTFRMEIEDRGGILDQLDHPPVIIAFWHNRIITAAIFWERHCRPRRALTFISRSRDGQFISDVAAHFGIEAARGSSSKFGTSAALAARRASEDNKLDLVITPDGPRGPRCVIQPGVLRLAQTTGRPIVAVCTHLQWKYVLKSWDRFEVPLPFSRCQLLTSERVFVPKDATEIEVEEIRVRLTSFLSEEKRSEDSFEPSKSKLDDQNNFNC